MSTASKTDPAVEKRDPVYGTGATPAEKNLARGAGAAGAILVLVYVLVSGPGLWAPWQYLIAAVLAFDLIGGVVANGLNSAKREHFSESAPPAGWLGALVRRPVLFTAVHVQPILIGLLFPGGTWLWGLAWYAATLGFVAVVRACPLYLQRPVALTACAAVAVIAPMVGSPLGMAWVPVILVLKLVLAHAVQEEGYRSSAGRQTAQRH